ncbi:lipase family protein [Olivibacter sp. SDN3]|uniref:lipase family protein n=1 Tax=Olivibacter sp. SDN3 TaxID=2764720 RepID=UPI0016519E17|nr:lipase family protein [Olivibacter sp. SDN3]QNL50983.1 lipase family protein [Olivibacter sp. SDN3]
MTLLRKTSFAYRRLFFIVSMVMVLLWPVPYRAHAQELKTGFDKQEYLDMLRIVSSLADTLKPGPDYLESPAGYLRVYRSPELGLRNRWDLWLREDTSAMVISIRGTVNDGASWLENFYSVMLPAQGSIRLNDSTLFDYHFADNQRATVHAGWTIGIASMAPGIIEKIEEQYENNVRNIYVVGHSQGGALAFLLNSLLRYKIKHGELPSDLKIKTYCSAAPKPGNLYYAYDFDFINRGGWAFTVVNASDWVPETPFSLQALDDFNHLNPFTDAYAAINKQKSFLVRLYLKHAYKKLDRSSKKSRKNFKKYLGKDLYKQIHKLLPEMEEPTYAESMNYMRAGTPIVLQPDEEYYKLYPDTGHNVFVHHALKPYAYLVEKQY